MNALPEPVVGVVGTARGELGYRSWGDPDGLPVVCLHGFPDDASTFDGVATALAEAGCRSEAAYLRGYAPSTVEGPLDLASLVEDLIAFLDARGLQAPVNLVGHDYGAQIGFAAMARHPGRFRSAVAFSGAHPAAIAVNVKRHPRQVWMSRYIVFFQLAGLADRWVARRSFACVDRLWRRWSPGFDPGEHLEQVKVTLARSMPAPVAMYRAGGFDIGETPISVPTLFITGAQDGCVLPAMSNRQERYFSGPYSREVWEGVGHFPHLEDPSRAVDAVVRWLDRHARP